VGGDGASGRAALSADIGVWLGGEAHHAVVGGEALSHGSVFFASFSHSCLIYLDSTTSSPVGVGDLSGLTTL
jgi:hypothetical protein